MIKIEYKYLDNFNSISDLYITLEDDGLTSEEIQTAGDELLEKGKAITNKSIYKLVGCDLFVARKNNIVEILD